MKIARIDARIDGCDARLAVLRERLGPRGDIVSEQGRGRTIAAFGEPLSPQQVVERICRDVRDRGADALFEYSRKLDRFPLEPHTLRVDPDAIARAHRAASPEFLSTIRRIRSNIVEFQTAILHRDVELTRPGGVRLRQRYTPLRRVGVCVPGGAAAYPSTVLMTVVPAQVAGVNEIAVVAPPTDHGAHHPDVLAVCRELGIDEVYRIGGAQAVAALAYGVPGVPRVDKIAGPGNLFVALAKKWVYGEVDIDSIAGPSEVVVVADERARPEFVAADLLAQAEHSPGAGILVSWSDALLEGVERELSARIARLSRAELTVQSLAQFGALIRARDADHACAIADAFAPEHLHITTRDPERLLQKIPHAGAAFLGDFSPVSIGDYAAGPSHVLPTGGTARWASGLTANTFLRGNSVIEYAREALEAIADDVRRLADIEGLSAHRASVDVRLEQES